MTKGQKPLSLICPMCKGTLLKEPSDIVFQRKRKSVSRFRISASIENVRRIEALRIRVSHKDQVFDIHD